MSELCLVSSKHRKFKNEQELRPILHVVESHNRNYLLLHGTQCGMSRKSATENSR